MARQVFLPLDPRGATGNDQTSGQWLTAEMARRGLSNSEFFARLCRLGFTSTSGNIVSMWRTDRCAISLEALPLVLEALDIAPAERPLWALHFLRAVHPRFVDCLGGMPCSMTEGCLG
jgi:hypothetical protein